MQIGDNSTQEQNVTPPADGMASVPAQLPPTRAPPMSTPTQNTTIPPAIGLGPRKFKECVFWLMCESDARVCGGIDEDSCAKFGKHGTGHFL